MKKLHFSEIMNLLLVAVIIVLIFRLTPAYTSQTAERETIQKSVKTPVEKAEKKEKNSELKILSDSVLQLPNPAFDSEVSVEYALANRRSQRNFTNKALSSREISQILWAAYGVTKPYEKPAFLRGGLKTAPSAGGRYPLEIYLLAGNIADIPTGLYKYIPAGHQLKKLHSRDVRSELAEAALNQLMLQEAPAGIVYTAIFERNTSKYGDRGRERYVPMDVGHTAQNVYLQATAMGLGTCAVGAFYDDKVAEVLELPDEEEPLMLMPLGYYKGKE